MDELYDSEKIFNKATNFVKSIVGKLNQNQLLHLYGLFKVATVGVCTTSKPPFYDFEGCKKWHAWKSCASKTSDDAKLEYVNCVNAIDSTWLGNAAAGKETFGVSVSKPIIPLQESKEGSIFDWVKENDHDKVNDWLQNHDNDVNICDSEAMSLLHWACDRGNVNMVALLISKGANINAKDSDQQTPLHYAVSCSHYEVTKELIKNHADKGIKDNEGQLPSDVAECEKIRNLFESNKTL